MSYANILVSVDLGDAAPDRIRLAAGLARRFGATLMGVAANKPSPVVLVRDIQDAVEQEQRNEARARSILERSLAVFGRGAGDGIRADWRAGLVSPTRHLVEQARAADLVVLSRRGPDDEEPGPLGVMPGPVLMEAGRPVLIVPPRIAHLQGMRIVVAWKDGPEARRAVSAALPFLCNADQVFVVTVGENAEQEGAEDVAGHLARHGAGVTAHVLPSVGSEGDAIQDFAMRRDADLIVMGAYGHSRLREWIFGGVTHDLLERSPVCCLMCH